MTAFSAEQFIPAEVMGYLGSNRLPALYKQMPEDFTVEERPRGSRGMGSEICTVTPDMGPGGGYRWAGEKPSVVRVVLVKRQMNTWEGLNLLSSSLGIDNQLTSRMVTAAGLKDRTAVTAQAVTIDRAGAGIPVEAIIRACCPAPIRGSGWFIKDPRPAQAMLRKGHLEGNRFTLNVKMPGRNAQQIIDYLSPRLKKLEANGHLIPNLYGRQRLGNRQNMHLVGKTLIEEGAKPAIRRFLCEVMEGREHPGARELRKKLGEIWDRRLDFRAMKNLLEMPINGRPAYKAYNINMEHQIVSHLAAGANFQEVAFPEMENSRKEGIFSLMVGAYQGFWFNQALSRIVSGQLHSEELSRDGQIPMLSFDQEWVGDQRTEAEGEVLRFYRKYLPEAVPHRTDPEARRYFLTPGRNRWGKTDEAWRTAMIKVSGLTHKAVDTEEGGGVWQCQFELPSGAYATTLLGFLFDIHERDDDRGGGDRSHHRHNGHGQQSGGHRRFGQHQHNGHIARH